MAQGSRRTASPGEWLGLTEASHLLGVSPATLRRWSDAGRVNTFTTPGGHRRFRRSALERMLPSDRSGRPGVRALGMTAERLARAYRRERDRDAAPTPWLVELSADQRARFRQHGRDIAVHLLGYLDGDSDEVRAHRLREATAAAGAYGRLASEAGLSLSQAVEGFLHFRAPFLGELMRLGRGRGLDAAETTDLVQTTERAMDRLLLATMAGHSVAAVGAGRSTAE